MWNTWGYDVLGNHRMTSCSGNCSTLDSSACNADNQLVRRVTYDASAGTTRIGRFWSDRTGNRLARIDSSLFGGSYGPQEMLSYTARNQLFFSMTPQAAPGAYDLNWHWYDASGLRVKTHVNSGTGWAPPSVPDGSTGSTTYYVYDGADVAITLLRFGTSWSVRQRFLSGGVDQPLAAWTSEGGGLNLAFVTDYQGSVRAAVKANGQRETNASYWSRNAFGGMNGAGAPGGVQTQTGFTGASTPNASGGFTYLRNRWYDPQTGRFLTQDPIGLAGGVNLYAYAGNDPISFDDPFGLCPCAIAAPWVPPALAGATALTLAMTSQARGLADAVSGLVADVGQRARDFKFVTYTRTHPISGQVYSGRTSGTGSPEALVQARAASHPLRLAGFGPPVVDRVARGTLQGFMATRGREQQLIDANGGAQSEGGTSANRIRSVAKPIEGPFIAQANNPANWIR